jgi:proteasome lid subunit RPN8/RPN11
MLSKLAEALDFDIALKFGAEERCGVIAADGSIMEVPNIHEEPVKGFHMEPTCFLVAVEAGAVATWHTHPGRDPNLSEEDMAGFRAWPQLEHHIIGIRDGEPTVHSFRVIDDGVVVTA